MEQRELQLAGKLNGNSEGPKARASVMMEVTCSICKSDTTSKITNQPQGVLFGQEFVCNFCHTAAIMLYAGLNKFDFEASTSAEILANVKEIPANNRALYLYDILKNAREKKRLRESSSSSN